MEQRSSNDVLAYRFAQVLVFAPCFAYVIWQLWWVVVFPRDFHPYFRIVLCATAAGVPASIWMRDIRRSVVFHRIAAAIGFSARVVAAIFALLFAGWVGWLFTGPYSGPMSAEVTIISFSLGFVGCVASLALALEPLLIDHRQKEIPRRWKRTTVVFMLLFVVGWTGGLIWGQPVAVALGLAS